jgi:saccharopine dehydrogenase (NAD+, L-lysine-forming)
MTKARALVATLNSPKVKAIPLDAEDPASIKETIQGADVVLNCVGPFYRTVKTILGAVIESGINYVDVCDDVDVTIELLRLDEVAKKAGITALIGMGSSPGVTNVLAKLAAESLLEETNSIDIFHAHGGEPFEGEGVVAHRFHCISIPIPMFLDGQVRYVNYFGEDGIALRQTFDFPVLGPNIPIYPYPHPEQVTIPRFIKVRQVTNKGTVLPNEYYDLTREMCRLGLASKKSLNVGGQTVIPHDFAIAYIIQQRDRILRETHFGEQRGCVSVIAKGKKNSAYREYRFHLASRSQALGEGTGIPAAIGVILMKQGKIKAKGVLPPEACVEPFDFIGLVPTIMELDKQKEGGRSFGGIIVQKVDADGTVVNIDI